MHCQWVKKQYPAYQNKCCLKKKTLEKKMFIERYNAIYERLFLPQYDTLETLWLLRFDIFGLLFPEMASKIRGSY